MRGPVVLETSAQRTQGDEIPFEAGGALLEGDRAGVINYISNTLFETVNVSMNNTPVSHSGSNYAQRAILEMLLNYGRDAVESWAQCGLFYKDTPG